MNPQRLRAARGPDGRGSHHRAADPPRRGDGVLPLRRGRAPPPGGRGVAAAAAAGVARDAAQADHDGGPDQRPRRTWTRRRWRGRWPPTTCWPIPVVDEENKLVGIITVDDVIDVIKEEATEDINRLAGVAGDERAFTPAMESLRKRLPWLGVNLVTAFLAAAVVALFEGTIDLLPGAGDLHAHRRRHGRQRRHADADGGGARHRAGRADLEQLPEGAAEGSGRRHRQRRGAGRAGRAGRLGHARQPGARAWCWAWR